jgi:hypothetical protein
VVGPQGQAGSDTNANAAFAQANIAFDQANAAFNYSNTLVESADLTTANVLEVTNLYFSNARVYANVESIGYSSNSYVNTRLSTKANVVDLTTSNVTEGSNLYYSNARVQTYLEEVGNIFPSGNNIQDLGRPTNRFKDLYLSGNSIYLGSVVLSSSDNGTFAIQSSGTTLNVATITDLTTANVSEVTNLYFTNARADLRVGPAFEVANIATINASSAFDAANTKTIAADLTTANVLEVTNLYFTNARVYSNVTQLGYITSSSLSGYATNSQLDAYALDEDLTTANVTEVNNLYFTNARVYSNVVQLNYATVSHVSSEIANLVNSAPSTLDTLNELSAALGNDPNFATTTATLIGNSYNQANAAFAQANISTTTAQSAFTQANAAYDYANTLVTSSDLTTANVLEVTNLYYTNARVFSAVTGNLALKANVADLTTANVSELTNLYFTNTRAISALTAGNNISIAANGLITSTATGGGGGGGASVTVANAAPQSATEGDLYFDDELLTLFVYYDDGDTQQWVEASPASSNNPFEFSRSVSGSETELYRFDSNLYRSAKFTVTLEDSPNFRIEDILLIHDGSNVTVSAPYVSDAFIGSVSVSYSANITNGNVLFNATSVTGSPVAKGIVSLTRI